MAATDVVSTLQREVELAKEGLRSVDEDIKKLTGRDPSEARGPVGRGGPMGNRRGMKRNFGDRISGPPQKRFNSGSTFNRLGPRTNERNNHRRSGPLESDGEEEEDDVKKPTLQSSIVATPAPSRQQHEVNTDKKTQTRNKRMFGVLLGTLQKFKENSTKEAARERKRKQIEKKLEEAAIKEREQAIQQKKELFFARREQKTKLEELERKMAVAEMLEEWEEHDRKLSKFIRTNTKPHIFYLPAKHNDYTLGLLEKTAELVDEEIKKRRQEIQEILHKPVEGKDERSEQGAGDSQEIDPLQEVEHSEDDEGDLMMKGGHREVIVRGRRGLDDDAVEMNEEGKSRNEELEAGNEEVKTGNDEAKSRNDEGELKNEEVEAGIEKEIVGSEEVEARRNAQKDEDVETGDVKSRKSKDNLVDAPKIEVEKDRGGLTSELSQVNKVKNDGNEVKESRVEAEMKPEKKGNVEIKESKVNSEEKQVEAQGTKQESSEDVGVNRNPESESGKDSEMTTHVPTMNTNVPASTPESKEVDMESSVVNLEGLTNVHDETKHSKMEVDGEQ